MKQCAICGKDFEAKRADAKICSAVCRQKAKRAGMKFRGPNAGIPPLTPEAAKEVVSVPINSINKGLNAVQIPEKEIKKMATLAAEGTFMGEKIPKGLTGIDLTIWKAQIKEAAR